MSLKELEKDLPNVLATSLDDPYEKIVIPCLRESSFFHMGVGFFESGWIDLAKEGLIPFVENGGKMLLLTSVKVGEAEYQAFQNGEKAKTDKILEGALVEKALENAKRNGKEWTLSYLAWMVSQGILDVRLLIHKESITNMYHEKLAFWRDKEGNEVCTSGSLNATKNATENMEIVNVFASWRSGGDAQIQGSEEIWNYEWSGQAKDYFMLDLPEIVKNDYKDIASPDNPYHPSKKTSKLPPKPTIEIRDYQKDALKALKSNGYRGILSMATGTGKTYTSLFAAKQITEESGPATILVCVPQTTLIDQWEEAIHNVFGFPNVIKCAFDKASWFSKFACALRTAAGKGSVFAVTTYDSLTNASFQKIIQKAKGNFIYIFDECHKLGTPNIVHNFIPKDSSYRIGLSATPERWFDKNGTEYVKDTIGKTVYEYSMEEAIKNHMLCEYNYHVVLSSLTDKEMSSFLSETEKISRLSNGRGSDDDMSDDLKLALERRAKISKKAENKWDDFFETFASVEDKTGSIVYVFDEQVDDMIQKIKSRFNLNVHGIVASTKNQDRQNILKGFNDGTIDVLVAIQCLDEGVDIPNCHAEFILASSTNPREFIQRRGRVLRKSKRYPNKVAEIYDFVTIAPDSYLYGNDAKLKVVARELPRVAEFNRLSKNKDDSKIVQYLISIDGLNSYVKESPWTMKSCAYEEEDE